jgi:hypothetical protein
MGSITCPLPSSNSESERQAARAAVEAEERLHTADYVVARGLLLPATEYLGRAGDTALAQGNQTGGLLTLVRRLPQAHFPHTKQAFQGC